MPAVHQRFNRSAEKEVALKLLDTAIRRVQQHECYSSADRQAPDALDGVGRRGCCLEESSHGVLVALAQAVCVVQDLSCPDNGVHRLGPRHYLQNFRCSAELLATQSASVQPHIEAVATTVTFPPWTTLPC